MTKEPHFVGWQGKLPALGDFASRGLASQLQSIIQKWIAEGMHSLSIRDPDEWQHAYLVTPVWHFVMNAGIWHPHALQGCLAPSLDKVGRYSPLLIIRSFEPSNLTKVLPPASDWAYFTDAKLREVIGQRLSAEQVLLGIGEPFAAQQTRLETPSAANILDELGIASETDDHNIRKRWFSWPDLNKLFTERIHRSFWWAEPSPKQPPRQIIHAGQPDQELFVLLMGGTLFA